MVECPGKITYLCFVSIFIDKHILNISYRESTEVDTGKIMLTKVCLQGVYILAKQTRGAVPA